MIARDDFRPQIGEGPGLHAFVCGVSYYHHLAGGNGLRARQDFGIRKPLSGPATTAASIYEWLTSVAADLRVPLATTRLLLSPSAAEMPTLSKYAAPRCSWEMFEDAAKSWHKDAYSHPGNYTLFYFAGHGVQRSGKDAVMLMENYGDGVGSVLHRGVPVINLIEGMAPGANLPESNIARKQFYFVDCCRIEPDVFAAKELASVSEVLTPIASPLDDRAYPIFFAAIPGSAAISLQNQLTVFGEAVIECLKGGAAEIVDDGNGVEWWVTSHSLLGVLQAKVDQLNRAYNVNQKWQPDGAFLSASLVRAHGPPEAKVALHLDPDESHPFTRLEVTDVRGTRMWDVPKPVLPHPFVKPLPVGLYQISAMIDPSKPEYIGCVNKSYAAEWPEKAWKVKVKP